ncbi:MAG TPA: CRISPR-associated endonuclease Cas1 [Chthonomonas sp.]|uniref:CRISPR-associated endonuclease Cas1 n=1 Tax=Chthonomonas sp. TaxID=2282153 RepID=UPI002B4B8BFB|nr:CRISPR-associated endonuclease Cas1 [Chthonomonas sp.]HLI47387.1 CRISPR-associated endonuclease Cas1 [Chthonomonas sp.]
MTENFSQEFPHCLVFTEFGLFLGKHSERLIVKKAKETIAEYPLLDLEQVIIAAPGISLSSDLVAACMRRGIAIVMTDYAGRPYAHITSPALHATVRTRRAQLMAYNEPRGVEIARRFAMGKIQNQINLLRYFGKYRKRRGHESYAHIEGLITQLEALLQTLPHIEGAGIEAVRDAFLNVEGRAASLYWQGVCLLLPPQLFPGRVHQGAADPVNALLNYGYGILYSQVWNVLLLAGLEPFAGFLHADRPGKPSLVLDFIEEFRQPIVDRTVIALFNKGFVVEWETPDAEQRAEKHVKADTGGPRKSPEFLGQGTPSPLEEEGASPENTDETPSQQMRLSADTRRALAAKIFERLEDTEPFEGKRRKLRHILQIQARHLATFLRGEGDYKPYIARW